MDAVFLQLLNKSIAAGWLVLAVIVIRVVLKKAPKWVRGILWALVAIRLISPFSLESVFSLIPSAETIPQDIMYMQEPKIHSGVSLLNSTVNPVLSESFAPAVGDSANPLQILTYIAAILWIVGLVAMVLYAGGSFLRIRRKVEASVLLRDNLHICDYIETPFILGIIKPRIYIPSTLPEDKVDYVIAHERAHLKRHDHWWKPLGFAVLTVYWFHPLIWIAYVLLCRDIELACDERVIKELGEGDKTAYSDALLFCSVPRRMIMACPLAFGEVGVKERVRTVLNYKKPAFWVVVAAVAVCMVVAICFLTNPKRDALYAPEPFAHSYYISSACLYMNPLSSTLSFGDSGETYQFVEDALVIINNASGNEQRIIPQNWEWQEFPYTDEEWDELFVPGTIENHISDYYEDRKYLRLSDRYRLLLMDGELWLLTMSENPRMGEYLWSIYTLVPAGSMGSAQWEYQPMFSSRYPAFPIEFAIENAEIIAYCNEGTLVDFDYDNGDYPQGTNITIPSDSKLYWSPSSNEGDVPMIASRTQIGFYIKKDNIIIYSGTIYITSNDNGGATNIYTARLVGSDMVMEQNEESGGAIIKQREASTVQ